MIIHEAVVLVDIEQLGMDHHLYKEPLYKFNQEHHIQ